MSDLIWTCCIRKAPRDGKVIDLPFLGRLLQVELPTPFKPQLLETTPFDMNKLKPDVQVGWHGSMGEGGSGSLIEMNRIRSWHHYQWEVYITISETF